MGNKYNTFIIKFWNFCKYEAPLEKAVISPLIHGLSLKVKFFDLDLQGLIGLETSKILLLNF